MVWLNKINRYESILFTHPLECSLFLPDSRSLSPISYNSVTMNNARWVWPALWRVGRVFSAQQQPVTHGRVEMFMVQNMCFRSRAAGFLGVFLLVNITSSFSRPMILAETNRHVVNLKKGLPLVHFHYIMLVVVCLL